jgi:hypothetical protein
MPGVLATFIWANGSPSISQISLHLNPTPTFPAGARHDIHNKLSPELRALRPLASLIEKM